MTIIYSKKFIKAVSIFSIVAATLLTARTGMRIFDIIVNYSDYTVLSKLQFFKFISIIVNNLIFIGIFIFLIFKPQRFILLGVIALFISIDNLISNVQSPYMGIPMYTLSIATFAVRGFFSKKTKLKISFFTAIYIISLILPVLFDDDFIEHMITKIAISFVTLIALFFFTEYAMQKGTKQATKDKVLNLAAFKGLDRSDMYLLQQVLDNVKYKEIAQKIHGSEGALRNKLSKIYKVLEVGDRTGFLTIYSGYELIYEPELIDSLINQS
ncbi:hypothetical protein TRBR_26900 [Treponema bryantii]|nr:hypothetical protein TRBR_26900 [Treponema bryantii]